MMNMPGSFLALANEPPIPFTYKWQSIYKDGVNQWEYIPDFVAQLKDKVIMIETKMRNDLANPLVTAKAEAAI